MGTHLCVLVVSYFSTSTTLWTDRLVTTASTVTKRTWNTWGWQWNRRQSSSRCRWLQEMNELKQVQCKVENMSNTRKLNQILMKLDQPNKVLRKDMKEACGLFQNCWKQNDELKLVTSKFNSLWVKWELNWPLLVVFKGYVCHGRKADLNTKQQRNNAKYKHTMKWDCWSDQCV